MSAPEGGHTNDLTPDENPVDHNILDDGDSGYSQSTGSEWTASLGSSILRYREENGRTYHAYRDGKYNIPNDEIENNRLDLQNHLFLLTLEGKLFLSPIKDIHNCLDVGTGTGIWAMDFADEHPETEVVGVDLSPIQPSWVPPNLQFMIDDVEEPWTFSQKFDFIHERMMVGSFLSWESFLEKSMSALKPGGYVELQDVHTLHCDDMEDFDKTSLFQWWDLVGKAFDASGRSMLAGGGHKQRLIDAGFQEVEERIFKWPLNVWPKDKRMKEIGLWSRENVLDALEGLAIGPLTRHMGWTAEEVKILCAKARVDIKNLAIHSYWCIHVAYGKKPLETTSM